MLTFLSFLVLAVEPEGGGSLIDVNPGVIFWTVITFVLLLLILKKFAWKPILTALDQRETAIKDSLDRAEKANEDAQKILSENQASLEKAEEESKKIISQSRIYAEKLKEQILQDSKAEAKKIIDEASAEIERKKDSAFDELKTQVSEIAIRAAEIILKENLNKETQIKVLNNYIDQINKN